MDLILFWNTIFLITMSYFKHVHSEFFSSKFFSLFLWASLSHSWWLFVSNLVIKLTRIFTYFLKRTTFQTLDSNVCILLRRMFHLFPQLAYCHCCTFMCATAVKYLCKHPFRSVAESGNYHVIAHISRAARFELHLWRHRVVATLILQQIAAVEVAKLLCQNYSSKAEMNFRVGRSFGKMITLLIHK